MIILISLRKYILKSIKSDMDTGDQLFGHPLISFLSVGISKKVLPVSDAQTAKKSSLSLFPVAKEAAVPPVTEALPDACLPS